jgi:primosomal protein N'
VKQIIKRLELIKTSIDIEDDEIIELQTMKLNSMDIDNSVKEILVKIQNHDLGRAMIDIEEYIKRYSGVVIYEDSEVSGLKMELKILENKLSDLSYTKDEYQNDINDFNLMYHQKLGDIIENILDLQQKIYYQQENFEEYQYSKQEYEEFKQDNESSKQKAKETHTLNEEEKKEFKALWKKASKLCHPDIVSDEQKAQATEIMQQLNDAYSKKDLLKVKEILNSLENGVAFDVASDTIDDKEVLKAKIEELRKDIAIIEQEIKTIQEDETYQIINSTDDLDEYFDTLRSHLEDEYQSLQDEFKQL